MVSKVNIANLAVGNLGDRATISSLDPPEGSPQAEHCAQFYPIARDAILEMHAWTFATRRVSPSAVTSPSTTWAYAYTVPSDCVRVVQIMPPSATHEPLQKAKQPPWMTEVLSDGSSVVLTNQASAVMRYTFQCEDEGKFSPLFVLALSWQLSAMLAGPMLKGKTGAQQATACLEQARFYVGQAKMMDANQSHVDLEPDTPWITDR